MQIGSPSASYGGSNGDPIQWLDQFFAACVGCKVDFINTHVSYNVRVQKREAEECEEREGREEGRGGDLLYLTHVGNMTATITGCMVPSPISTSTTNPCGSPSSAVTEVHRLLASLL